MASQSAAPVVPTSISTIVPTSDLISVLSGAGGDRLSAIQFLLGHGVSV